MNTIEFGYLFLTEEEEAEQLGISTQTLKKYHKRLISKGYLEIIEVNGKKIKKFNLLKLTEYGY